MLSDAMSLPQRTIVLESSGRKVEVWPTPTDENFLWHILSDLFEGHWRDIVFGPLVLGAAWEVVAPCKPERVSLLDGYLTVDFGAWHFHLCIGPVDGVAGQALFERCTARAEFYRMLDAQEQPKSWGFRMFTGAGTQQITVLLPNPLLTTDRKISQQAPDWTRLQLWDRLRRDCLGLLPDPVDRLASAFRHD